MGIFDFLSYFPKIIHKDWAHQTTISTSVTPLLTPLVLQSAEAALLRNTAEHKSHLSLSCQFITWDFYTALYMLLPSSEFVLVHTLEFFKWKFFEAEREPPA